MYFKIKGIIASKKMTKIYILRNYLLSNTLLSNL